MGTRFDIDHMAPEDFRAAYRDLEISSPTKFAAILGVNEDSVRKMFRGDMAVPHSFRLLIATWREFPEAFGLAYRLTREHVRSRWPEDPHPRL